MLKLIGSVFSSKNCCCKTNLIVQKWYTNCYSLWSLKWRRNGTPEAPIKLSELCLQSKLNSWVNVGCRQLQREHPCWSKTPFFVCGARACRFESSYAQELVASPLLAIVCGWGCRQRTFGVHLVLQNRQRKRGESLFGVGGRRWCAMVFPFFLLFFLTLLLWPHK